MLWSRAFFFVVIVVSGGAAYKGEAEVLLP